ncbi:hypothetical protein GALL_85250 [mine drainage metagenome]|uniref:Inner membrane protein YgaP-like transmembrane domain-containing protein n=1 Tax=mine drainage metagenome TaxID=410659 RepID=A0A1J5T657_9ZZZZ
MKIESYIRIIAGSMVLLSVLLAYVVNPWWLLLAVLVGLNLIQSAFTGFCPAEMLLRRLGVGRTGETPHVPAQPGV